MTARIEFCQTAPDRPTMDGLLTAYYATIFARLTALGGPNMSPDAPIADFWAHIADFLPPKGQLLIGWAEDGTALGCGSLSVPEPGTGELKRLFVHKTARGTGLGRALVTHRIEAARDMGLRRLLVDTLANTHEMQALYASLGFREIPRYPQSSTANAFPDWRPFMKFFQLDL